MVVVKEVKLTMAQTSFQDSLYVLELFLLWAIETLSEPLDGIPLQSPKLSVM
jgi:hypothetical protein